MGVSEFEINYIIIYFEDAVASNWKKYLHISC